MRTYALETLSDTDASLVVDGWATKRINRFLKQGKGRCGVARQYAGSAGQITNCQIGVFAAYVSRHGHALIDRPKARAEDTMRRATAQVPPEIRFATQPRLAVDMIERAIAAGVPLARVAADRIYGVSELEMTRRRAGKGYVLGSTATISSTPGASSHRWGGTAAAIGETFDALAWQALSAGEGTQVARLYDWAYLELADLEAEDFNPDLSGTWTRGLLIRRPISDQSLAYFSTWCPAGTRIETLVAVEGRRWAIEDSFETAKTELGLGHNETRSWHGWHRHVSLVMLAFAMLTTIRHHANHPVASQTPIRLCQSHS